MPQEVTKLNLGKKISIPRDVMLEELSLLTNKGSKMFKLRQLRVEKFIYENNPDAFTDNSVVGWKVKLQSCSVHPGGTGTEGSQVLFLLSLRVWAKKCRKNPEQIRCTRMFFVSFGSSFSFLLWIVWYCANSSMGKHSTEWRGRSVCLRGIQNCTGCCTHPLFSLQDGSDPAKSDFSSSGWSSIFSLGYHFIPLTGHSPFLISAQNSISANSDRNFQDDTAIYSVYLLEGMAGFFLVCLPIRYNAFFSSYPWVLSFDLWTSFFSYLPEVKSSEDIETFTRGNSPYT